MAHDQHQRRRTCFFCATWNRVPAARRPRCRHRTVKKGRRVTRTDHMATMRSRLTGGWLREWQKLVDLRTLRLQQAWADFEVRAGAALARMCIAKPLIRHDDQADALAYSFRQAAMVCAPPSKHMIIGIDVGFEDDTKK